ncbi:probable small nuclear ribonucleoprotein G [Drosophila albomicans]|uniref:Small nuclear ribonucleoprotein G n=1 Tax=Drosophila albomicans TaxID=7291 RepID=A0A6P8W7K0_DROAB|nr:probable small nuclear ribonucleoprotein G [Drosophila albomicans]
MSKAHAPDLKRYMGKRIMLSMSGARTVTGILRGYDPFMNVVLEEAVELEKKKKNSIGIVIVRGNSIVNLEVMERV